MAAVHTFTILDVWTGDDAPVALAPPTAALPEVPCPAGLSPDGW
ncbi:hypothetical protein [Micromonospora inyonensis]|nr:hypothetical protein [Micromonospora inyonensis]